MTLTLGEVYSEIYRRLNSIDLDFINVKASRTLYMFKDKKFYKSSSELASFGINIYKNAFFKKYDSLKLEKYFLKFLLQITTDQKLINKISVYIID